MDRGQLSQVVETRLKLAGCDQGLRRCAGRAWPDGNLGSSGSVGTLETAAIGHYKVDDRRGDLDVLRTGGGVAGLLMLHQPDVFLAMDCGQNIVSGEIQDHPTGISLHGLRAGIDSIRTSPEKVAVRTVSWLSPP